MGATMVPVLLALLLQTPPLAGQPVDLPVSLERVREGLGRSGRFELPPHRPRGRAVFRLRVEVEQPMFLFPDAWAETSMTPPWIRSSAPAMHLDFLRSVSPDESSASTLHPCCDVLPVARALTNAVSNRVQAAKQGRAKREVERAMRAAGIRR